MTKRMADSVTPATLPAGMDAYLGYSDGGYAHMDQIAAMFPGVPRYALDVKGDTSGADGEDSEPGNIGLAGAAACLAAEKARGVDRPIGYCSQSDAPNMVAQAQAHGLSGSATVAGRTDWRLLTAHYTGMHICGPATCGCPVEADGTQWADWGSWDESVLDDTFIAAASHPGPAPTPTNQEDIDMPLFLRDATTGASYTSDGVAKTYVPDSATYLGLQGKLGAPVEVTADYLGRLAGAGPA